MILGLDGKVIAFTHPAPRRCCINWRSRWFGMVISLPSARSRPCTAYQNDIVGFAACGRPRRAPEHEPDTGKNEKAKNVAFVGLLMKVATVFVLRRTAPEYWQLTAG